MRGTLYTLRDGRQLTRDQVKLELRLEGEAAHKNRKPTDNYLASSGYWFCPVCGHEVDNLNWKPYPDGAPPPGYLCLDIACGATGPIEAAVDIHVSFWDLMGFDPLPEEPEE